MLLRPGGVSRSEIEAAIGPVASGANAEASSAHPSPGMHPQHYSPRTPLILVSGGIIPQAGKGAYLLLRNEPLHEAAVVPMPDNPREYAARLYAVLHELDDRGFDWIAVDLPEEASQWEGVLDRLRRAAVR